MAPDQSLHDAQRQFLTALREPLSGEARSRTELPPGRPEVTAAFRRTANSLLRSTAAVSATERLGLYHRQYWYRLLDSLAEDFPRLGDFLGRERFWPLLERYLAAHPPTSYTLRHLGAGLAGFAGQDEGLPVRLRARASDLARCEYASMEVFAAPDFLRPSMVDFTRRSIRLSPAVRLVRLRTAIGAGTDVPTNPGRTPRQRGGLLVVWRDADHCLQQAPEAPALRPLLESLQTGGRLEEVLARVPRLPAPAVLTEAFARWWRRDWFALA
jgi:hypothetical protein